MGGGRLRRATLPAVDSWAWLSQETGNLLDQLKPLGASDPDGASGCEQGLGPVGPQNQSQLSRPVFSKGWLLKTGSPPRKQMFSTVLTKRNNESGTQACDAPSPSCWPRTRGQLRNQAGALAQKVAAKHSTGHPAELVVGASQTVVKNSFPVKNKKSSKEERGSWEGSTASIFIHSEKKNSEVGETENNSPWEPA